MWKSWNIMKWEQNRLKLLIEPGTEGSSSSSGYRIDLKYYVHQICENDFNNHLYRVQLYELTRSKILMKRFNKKIWLLVNKDSIVHYPILNYVISWISLQRVKPARWSQMLRQYSYTVIFIFEHNYSKISLN